MWREYIAKPISSIADAILLPWKEFDRITILWLIDHADCVDRLEEEYKRHAERIEQYPDVKSAYLQKKDQLSEKKLFHRSDVVIDWMAHQIAKGVDLVDSTAREKIIPLIEEFGERYNLHSEEIDRMKKLAESGEFGLLAVAMGLVSAVMYPYVYAWIGPMVRKAEQNREEEVRSALLSPDELISLKWRNPEKERHVKEELRKQGYTETDIAHLEEVRKYYPGPSDWIRFAVRDIFRKDVIEKYGYKWGWEEIESELAEKVSKVGMDVGVLEWYWLAHWELPSPTQAIEMVHRGAITEEDFRTLLKIADIAPYYVDAFMRIIYSPFTRVDIRRMYQDGVLNYDQILRAYKDIGYDEWHAEKLAEWTVKQKHEKDRDLTLTQVRKAYRIGKLTDQQFLSYLRELGYDEEEADFVKAIEDYTLQEEEKEDEIATARMQYVEGEMTEDEFVKFLQSLNLRMKEVERELNKAKRKKAQAVKTPSLGDLKTWLKEGIIDRKDFTSRLEKRGYKKQDIENYIKEVEGKR
ncbi:MAG: hypothetical protein ACXQTD_07455 [Candidatus Syntropharchaeia archaeon]